MKIYPHDGSLELRSIDGEDRSFQMSQKIFEMDVKSVDWPLYQKLASRDTAFQYLKKDTLTIWFPDGIGDVHWVFLKLKSLRDQCEAKRIIAITRGLTAQQDYYQRSGRAIPFLKMNPLIDEVRETSVQPFVFEEGFLIDDMGFDYVLDANPFLLTGASIKMWCPELEIDWDYWKTFSECEKGKALSGSPIIYFGNRFAEVTWGGEWSDKDWATLTRYIRDLFGERPILLGSGSDSIKARAVEKEGGVFINKVGETNFIECFQLLMSANIVVGSISGLTILSAAMGVPTVAMWPDEQSLQPLPRRMYSSWLPEKDTEKTYYPFGYSSSGCLVQKAIEKLWGAL